MYHQFRSHDVDGSFVHSDAASIAIARASGFDALAALEQIGTRRSFTRDKAIYTESDLSDCWYKVISGTVRICKLLADGRRHIAEFCFPGDCFGLPASDVRIASAEAVGEAIARCLEAPVGTAFDYVAMRPNRPTPRILPDRAAVGRSSTSTNVEER